jgi:hypothetical protein
MAAVPVITALVGFLNPHVRNLETELPDAVRKPAPQPEPEPAAPVDDVSGEAAAQA